MTLEEIPDRMKTQDLMAEYCYAIDNCDRDALDYVFAPDAVIEYTEMVGVKR